MLSPDSPTAAAVVVAAGRGERFGAAGKVMAPLLGRPLLAYVLETIEATDLVHSVVIVAGEHTDDDIERLLNDRRGTKPYRVVLGGARRQDSVAAGVQSIEDNADVVVIHDGARPLATAALFDATIRVSYRIGAAIAAVPVADTLKRVGDDYRIIETVPREGVWIAQTPQAFRRDLLLAALATPIATEQTFTDEAALFEALGYAVEVVPGSARNIKVTRPDDLAIAEALLSVQSQLAAEPPDANTRPNRRRRPEDVGGRPE